MMDPLPVVSPPRAVLFDWDNTLVDTWPCILKAMNMTLVHMEHDAWTREEGMTRISRSLRESFPGLFGERWREAESVFYESFRSCHLDMLTPLPHAEALVRHICGMGVWVGIVSNKTGDLLRIEVEHLGWEGLFHRVAGAGDAKADKPHIEHILHALQGSGLKPGQDVWFVGDHAVDMQCATEAGCTPFLLHHQGPLAGNLLSWAPRGIYGSCGEFLDALRTLAVPSDENR